MKQRLMHYRRGRMAQPLVKAPQKPDVKPKGFWVSVEGEYDWPWWCRSERFRLERLSRPFEVTLAPTATVLTLTSPRELDVFTHEFGQPFVALPSSRYRMIDWPRVCALYQGLIIAPYQWERRMELHTFWYYGWDCASGVIWDPDAIQRIRRRKK